MSVSTVTFCEGTPRRAKSHRKEDDSESGRKHRDACSCGFDIRADIALRGFAVFVVSTLVFLGCTMSYYLLDDDAKNELWYRASSKKMVVLALIWLGQAFPILEEPYEC
jgi:hypothetical protein